MDRRKRRNQHKNKDDINFDIDDDFVDIDEDIELIGGSIEEGTSEDALAKLGDFNNSDIKDNSDDFDSAFKDKNIVKENKNNSFLNKDSNIENEQKTIIYSQQNSNNNFVNNYSSKIKHQKKKSEKSDELIFRPKTIEELGVSKEMLLSMCLKHLYYAGEMTGLELANKLKVPYTNIIDIMIDKLLKQKTIFYEGGRGFGRSSMLFTLTESGKRAALLALEQNRYLGPLPVALDYYKKVFANLKSIEAIKLDKIKELLSDLVLPENFPYSIGPAINSNHSIFLYGPPGNGKSVVADKIAKNLDGFVTIPYAIEIEGQIIKVYDKIFHNKISENENDQRWMKVKRPYIFVGGELTYEMLNLNFDPVSKVYEAPLQLKANGGIFLIDDFGRQKESPKRFLNRWIVPLENRIDVLNLSNGKSFNVPFDELIIFSTNLDPKDLIDEAFSRRIRYKIGMDNPNREMFLEIFKRMCKIKKIAYKISDIENFFFYNLNKTPKIRAVLPRDMLEIISKICEFENIEKEVNYYTLKKASEIGFIQDYSYSDNEN